MTRLAPIRAAHLLLLAGLAAPLPVLAEDAPAPQAPAPQASGPAATAPSAEDGRYAFHRIGDGFVRLDSRTGRVAQCDPGANGWSCKAAPEERAALESEIGRLLRDNAELKKSLASRGTEPPNGAVAQAPATRPVPPADVPDPSAREPKMPSDVELDRAIAFMKHVWRKLVDMMADLQRDVQRKS